MIEKSRLKIISYVIILFILSLLVLLIINKNFELVFYIVEIAVLTLIVIFYHKHLYLTRNILFGLFLFAALHILGVYIYIGDVRLYDFWIISNILKYDNIVHFIGSFVAALIAYNLLFPYIDDKIKMKGIYLTLLLILIVSGVGAFNEILELVGVIFFNAAKDVGGYMNNAFDLVFNLLGVLAASIYLVYYYKKDKK
ncbi:MAG: DUF2238 domain-containing protein [Nanoarchaeota archaeon]|nr:DUF2238 domain-containing protein [Nanoarchaeota archaeon]